jgi:hypothetical protein
MIFYFIDRKMEAYTVLNFSIVTHKTITELKTFENNLLKHFVWIYILIKYGFKYKFLLIPRYVILANFKCSSFFLPKILKIIRMI